MAKKIIIIDDDEDLLEMLQIVFQESDYDILFSSQGMSSDEIRVLHPDLVLIDVQIRGYDLTGDKICRDIKAAQGTCMIPVFLMSAERDIEALAGACHADGYFAKPFDVMRLKQAIKGKL